ncbi:MAG TPA: PQQ-binding-like beta-propeller repeat protein [Spirochaetota bacterium]|nr:PQQ-binding-like beta-propeller repeat protein [Spirochaetota bacterium]
MSENPFLKPLKAFDPANLLIDESFTGLIKNKTGSLQDDAEDDLPYEPESVTAEESFSLRTGGAIHSGCISLPNSINRKIYAAANIKGEIFFFEQGKAALQAVSKVTLHGAIYTPPVFSEGILYCVVREGTVFAVDTGLGASTAETDGIRNKLLWQKKMKKGILAEPVLAGKFLLVTTLDGIYAFETSNSNEKNYGSPVWGVSINGTVSTPAVDSGMLFIGSEDRRLFGFDYSGSKLRKLWDYELGGACRMKPFVSKSGDYVAAATTDGFVYAVDKKTGTYIWNFAVKAPVIGNIASAIISGSEHLFFGSDSGILYCLNGSGQCLWHFKAGGKIRTEPVANKGLIWFGCADNSLYALDMVTGKEAFKFTTDGNIYGKPLISGDRIFFGSTDGCIHSINI